MSATFAVLAVGLLAGVQTRVVEEQPVTTLENATQRLSIDKALVLKAFHAVESGSKDLLVEVRNGTRAGHIFESLLRRVAADVDTSGHTVKEDRKPVNKFDELFDEEKQKKVGQIQTKVTAVEAACSKLSIDSGVLVELAMDAGQSREQVLHENFLNTSWCDNIVLKSQRIGLASKALVEEIFSEVTLDKSRSEATAKVQAQLEIDEKHEEELRRQKSIARKNALAEAEANMSKIQAPEAALVKMAAAAKEVRTKIADIDAYVTQMDKYNASARAEEIKQIVDERISKEKATASEALHEALAKLTAAGDSDVGNQTISQWKSLQASAYVLRQTLSDISSPAYEHHEVLEYASAKAIPDDLATLSNSAAKAVKDFEEAAVSHVNALKAIGAPQSMLEKSKGNAERSVEEFKSRIQSKSDAADELVRALRSKILNDLHLEDEGTTLSARRGNFLALSSIAPTLGVVAVAMMLAAIVVGVKASRRSLQVHQEPLLG